MIWPSRPDHDISLMIWPGRPNHDIEGWDLFSKKKQPPGFEDPAHPNKVYRVVKALYGLHQ
ncbi:hypothetical protein Tco_0612057, partial [Tanacetum coccineum]